MRRAVLASTCLFNSPAAAAMSFEVTPLIGAGGYLDDGLPYEAGFAVGAAMGVRALSWLRVEASILLNPLGVEPDPIFQVDEPEALVSHYGLHAGARVFAADPFEVFVGPYLGGFAHTVGGDDGFGTVSRRVTGLTWGGVIDGWWQLTPVVALGARLQYSRLHATEICLETASGSERCRDPLPAEEQPTAHLTGAAALRFGF